MSPLFVFAHAFGARYDLPIPLVLFVLGGAVVVFASFLFVLRRAGAPDRVSVLPDRANADRSSGFGAIVGLVVLALLIVVGFIGSQRVAENILPTAFWLIVWIAIPISCAILGDWTPRLNPFATIANAANRPGLRHAVLGGPPVTWPNWLGWWPATALFFLVACGELIYNATATRPNVTAFGLLMYALLNVVAVVIFGSEMWLERGELFSVLYNTWGRLGWFRFGAPGTRGFGGGLKARFEPIVSRLTFVLLLLVAVSFDGLLATPAWKHAREHLPSGILPGTVAYVLLTSLAFFGLLVLAWILFAVFSRAVEGEGALDMGILQTLSGLVCSLLPIAFGYLVAHNAEYLVINGQLLFPLLGNPAGMTWWPHLAFPFNDSYEININVLPSSVVWYSQVILIVLVHIAAVILAHDYLAGAASTVEKARRAEWPWIVIMVIYTMSSLWLLAQPLVKGG